MPAIARAEKADAITLDVVPFDLKVVAHATEVVSFGGAAGANARMILPLGFVPHRTRAKPIRPIQRKRYRRL
jgi:hypothetical protein